MAGMHSRPALTRLLCPVPEICVAKRKFDRRALCGRAIARNPGSFWRSAQRVGMAAQQIPRWAAWLFGRVACSVMWDFSSAGCSRVAIS